MKKREKIISFFNKNEDFKFAKVNLTLVVLSVFLIISLSLSLVFAENPYSQDSSLGNLPCCKKTCTLVTADKKTSGLSSLGFIGGLFNSLGSLGIFNAGLPTSNAASGGKTVLYDFYTDWCGPCRTMNPTVQALINAGYAVQRINVDPQNTGKANPAITGPYRVTNIPTFIMFVNGKEVDRVVGGTSYSRLEGMVKLGQQQTPVQPVQPVNPIGYTQPVQTPANPSQLTPLAPLVPVKSPPTTILSQQSDKELCAEGKKECGKWTVACNGEKKDINCGSCGDCKSCSHGKCVADTNLISQNFPSSNNNNNNNNANTNNQINPNNLEKDLKSANVKIKIYDNNQGASGDTGSGTIIDSRNGWALILTCSHIFRQHSSTGPIVIQSVGNNNVNIQNCYVVDASNYDKDVALIAVPTQALGDFKIAMLAPKGSAISSGQNVYYTGCDNGGACIFGGTKVGSNAGNQIWINAAGVGGRSGGGLFDSNGNLIGVDNGVSGGQSLYAGLPYIYEILDKNNLGFVYKNPNSKPPINIQKITPNCKLSSTSQNSDGCCGKGGACIKCPQ
jgi:thiol-disulfide isomerase/thioredoxin